MSARLALAALAAEAAVGYPDALHRLISHPVVHVGNLISALERRWNRPERSEAELRALGIATVLISAGLAAGVGAAIQRKLPRGPLVLLAATTGLAQRSLFDHVRAVTHPLDAGDLPAARTAVARIVGRDTADLDASGIAAAGIETLAESFNDGITAPAFWLAVGGLPALFAYKAVNTADSLIGHMEPRFRAFGWAAARLDDGLNLIPARLAGMLIAAAGGRGLATMLRDAPRHASPNAGWPEAAMAGALNVTLGGPARYDGVETSRPTFGDGPAPVAADLCRGLSVYVSACALLMLGMGVLAWRRR